ncbi:MAG: nitrophenyl compound nitroreductase subunit ArsF family protein [Bacteroidales bacterium]|nr:nitrophenyl compound nitroreductase subunit ArsF family protein [Bacteroidales bacterium]MCF8457916.1 nitrophenyl compound nitroreductase subunit ArsF family protein [Bacteroidales bacterium]
MKQIGRFSLAFVLLFTVFSCLAQENHQQISPKVEVYYFYFTQRCNTCISVEENAKLAVESLFPDHVKKGEYIFKGINLDEKSSDEIARKLKIGGQTLIVVSGDKTKDITSEGFMNAHNLDKMKAEIKKAVTEVLKG